MLRPLHILAALTLLSGTVACGGASSQRWESKYDFASTPEAMCGRVNDPLELRVCRAEARLRVMRRLGNRDEVVCANDRLDQMHAALRERSEAKDHHVALANLPGFESDDEARSRRISQTIMRLWDELQAGVCQGPSHSSGTTTQANPVTRPPA